MKNPNPYADAVRFLLENVVATGHLPATALAQHHLDVIQESETPAPAPVPSRPAPVVPAESKAATGSSAGPKLVPDPGLPGSDPHNVAVKKTK